MMYPIVSVVESLRLLQYNESISKGSIRKPPSHGSKRLKKCKTVSAPGECKSPQRRRGDERPRYVPSLCISMVVGLGGRQKTGRGDWNSALPSEHGPTYQVFATSLLISTGPWCSLNPAVSAILTYSSAVHMGGKSIPSSIGFMSALSCSWLKPEALNQSAITSRDDFSLARRANEDAKNSGLFGKCERASEIQTQSNPSFGLFPVVSKYESIVSASNSTKWTLPGGSDITPPDESVFPAS